jgi:hypothetical protein
MTGRFISESLTSTSHVLIARELVFANGLAVMKSVGENWKLDITIGPSIANPLFGFVDDGIEIHERLEPDFQIAIGLSTAKRSVNFPPHDQARLTRDKRWIRSVGSTRQKFGIT